MKLILLFLGLALSIHLQAEPLYKQQDQIIEINHLPPALRQQAFEVETQRYIGLKKVFEEKVFGDYLDEQRAKTSLTQEEMRNKALTVAEPTDKELKKFYDENKQLIPYPLDAVRFELKEKLRAEKQFLKKQDLVRNYLAKKKITFLLPEPVAPVFEIALPIASPVRGEKTAKATLVEFGDFKCPYCAKAYPVLEKVVKKFGKKLQFVYLDFPPQIGGLSGHLAKGRYCANKAGVFWKYHEAAFSAQPSSSYDFPLNFAKKEKLNIPDFEKCMGAVETEMFVTASRAEGERLGVSKTPGLYLNGSQVNVDDGGEELEAKIKALL